MIKIKIPKKIKSAGFKVEVLLDDKTSKELKVDKFYGMWFSLTEGKFIKIDNTQSECELSNTFIHEIIEMINVIYLDGDLKHRHITAISNGLHQMLEDLGVRFVK